LRIAHWVKRPQTLVISNEAKVLDESTIKLAVEKKYSAIASRQETHRFCGVDSAIPSAASEIALSCGSPVSFIVPRQGMTLLDLGSGGGVDAFTAVNMLHGKGRVIGVDSSMDMVLRARRTAAERGYRNLEFRLGEMECLPISTASIDVVVSNCAVNLVPDKERTFGEMFRVLKPLGSLSISDIVAKRPLPRDARNDPSTWSECVSGAPTKRGLEGILNRIGLMSFKVTEEKEWNKHRDESLALAALTVSAVKPDA
jgi:ubiquinone/menaquinone biosynthesis C-methylase UbiE